MGYEKMNEEEKLLSKVMNEPVDYDPDKFTDEWESIEKEYRDTNTAWRTDRIIKIIIPITRLKEIWKNIVKFYDENIR